MPDGSAGLPSFLSGTENQCVSYAGLKGVEGCMDALMMGLFLFCMCAGIGLVHLIEKRVLEEKEHCRIVTVLSGNKDHLHQIRRLLSELKWVDESLVGTVVLVPDEERDLELFQKEFPAAQICTASELPLLLQTEPHSDQTGARFG